MEEIEKTFKTFTVSEEDYYKIGSSDFPVISNSALSCINPHQGGSFDKFNAFLDSSKDEEKTSRYMELGTLVHKYIKAPSDFIVSPLDKPDPMLCQWTESVYDVLSNLNIPMNKALNNDNKLLELYTTIKNDYGYYKNIKNQDKIEEYMLKSKDYLSFLYSSNGKVILTPAQKDTISKIQTQLYSSPEISRMVLGKDQLNIEEQRSGDEYSELGIVWLYNDLTHKGLLDKVWIDIPNKVVDIIDTKTTSDSVYTYMGYKRCIPYAAGENLNYPYNYKPRYELQPGAFQKYRTYRQLAIYVEAIRSYLQSLNLPAQDFKINCYILAIQTTEDCPCLLYEINPEWIFFGREEYIELLELVKRNILLWK